MPNNYLGISDSLSSITGIQNTTHPTDISKLILEKTYEARDISIDICYVWVPGHCGIQGIEKADHEATKAPTSIDTPYLNIYTYEDKKKTNQTSPKSQMAQIMENPEYKTKPNKKQYIDTAFR